MTDRAPWAEAAPKPIYRRVADPDMPRCAEIVRTVYDARRRPCPFVGHMTWQGKHWCRRHHPVRKAEFEAHRLNRLRETLIAAGFNVTCKPLDLINPNTIVLR